MAEDSLDGSDSSGIASSLENSGQEGIAGSGGESWPPPKIHDIPPQPIKRHHITDEQAEMLATRPRKHWDETTWAAFGGAIAALPSAVDAGISAFKREPLLLQGFELVQVGVFFAFLIWFLARKRHSNEETSIDLLQRLRRQG